jgi:AhpD family alkylhydroperoxidase
MRLDQQILELIAVGASVAANCQPCLEHNAGKALEYGADGQQIAEAIEVGKLVRRGAASKMDKFALSRNYSTSASTSATDGECGCES